MYHDLTSPTRLPLNNNALWDLAVCFEVAEHLEEKYAPALLSKLQKSASIIMMTAAEPTAQGKRGILHYNEQTNQYWIRKMTHFTNFSYDECLTAQARNNFNSANVISYLARPMIFVKNEVNNSL